MSFSFNRDVYRNFGKPLREKRKFVKIQAFNLQKFASYNSIQTLKVYSININRTHTHKKNADGAAGNAQASLNYLTPFCTETKENT